MDCCSALPHLRLETHGAGAADIAFITVAGFEGAITPKLKEHRPIGKGIVLADLAYNA